MKNIIDKKIIFAIMGVVVIFSGFMVWKNSFATQNLIVVCITDEGKTYVVDEDFTRDKCVAPSKLLFWNKEGPPGPAGPKGDSFYQDLEPKTVVLWENFVPSTSGIIYSNVIDTSGYSEIIFFISSSSGSNIPVYVQVSADNDVFIKPSNEGGFGLTEKTIVSREVRAPFYRLETEGDPDQNITIKAYLKP
jgi:hypothetical protein